MYEKQIIKLEAVIEIPEDKVIISKVEYEELKNNGLIGRYWSMSDLEKRINKSRPWILENILYVPKFKKELERFVSYPQSQGNHWSFKATKMAQFLEDNFYQIFHRR